MHTAKEGCGVNDHEPDLSVVIPCHNEGSHLDETLGTIRGVMDGLERPYELVIIDDGSTDETWRVLQQHAHDGLHALKLSRCFGKEVALCAGLERARGRAVIVMDGDLQHPPALIPDMVRAWSDEGYLVVEGVKADRSPDGTVVRVRAGAFHWMLRRLSGLDLRGASDFKLLDRRALNAWMEMRERNVFFRGMSAWIGFRRKELPFSVHERAGGRTAWTTRALFRLALTGITSFSSLPLQIITWMGACFFGFSILLGMYAVFRKLTGGAVTGFTTVIVLQLFIGSMVMIGLGILGIYISRIYDEVKGRPRYVIADELKSEEASPAD